MTSTCSPFSLPFPPGLGPRMKSVIRFSSQACGKDRARPQGGTNGTFLTPSHIQAPPFHGTREEYTFSFCKYNAFFVHWFIAYPYTCGPRQQCIFYNSLKYSIQRKRDKLKPYRWIHFVAVNVFGKNIHPGRGSGAPAGCGRSASAISRQLAKVRESERHAPTAGEFALYAQCSCNGWIFRYSGAFTDAVSFPLSEKVRECGYAQNATAMVRPRPVGQGFPVHPGQYTVSRWIFPLWRLARSSRFRTLLPNPR